MRSSHRLIMLSTAGCLASFLVGYAIGQNRRVPQERALGLKNFVVTKGVLPGVAANAAKDAEIRAARQPWVNVSSWLKIDDKDRPPYDRLAALISGFKDVPSDRLAYYAGYNDIGVARWNGSITKKQPREGGQAVTVQVGAILKNSGTPLSAGGYYENYFVSDQDEVTYLGSEDPRGGAGKLSGYIIN